MSRLPQPGADKGNWGEILNDYLKQSHDDEGLLKTDTVGAVQLKPVSVTTAALADTAVSTVKINDGAVTGPKLAPGLISPVGLSGNYTDLTGKPTIPATAADINAEPVGLSAATKTQIQNLVSPTAKAAALLRAAPQQAGDVYRLADEIVTITIALTGATSALPNARLRKPKRLTAGSTSVDMEGDTAFRYLSSPSATYGASFPDTNYIRPPLLTGGSSQAAFFTQSVRFYFDGQKFDLWQKCLVAGSMSFRLKIDGKYVAPNAGSGTVMTGGGEEALTFSNNSAGTLVAGSGYLFNIDFGSARQRVIEIESISPFGGIWHDPTTSLSRGPASSLVSAAVGDSIVGGAGTSRRTSNWSLRAAQLIGCDETTNIAIGGTGLTVGVGTSDLLTRLPDLIAVKPDVIWILTGQNDQGNAGSVFAAAANTYFAAVKAALPKAIVFVMGMWTIGNASATRISMNETLRAEAATAGFGFIDMIDPTGKGRTAPLWTASTSYALGDVVRDVATSAPYVCIVAHTSTSTWNSANWQATSWIYGTGKEGAVTGLGNSDVMIQSDGIHQTAIANDLIERRVAAAALNILRDSTSA